MIRIDFENDNTKLTFNNVKTNEFFICWQGKLCQKMNDRNANIIANKDGSSCADRYDNIVYNMPILKILGKALNVTWE